MLSRVGRRVGGEKSVAAGEIQELSGTVTDRPVLHDVNNDEMADLYDELDLSLAYDSCQTLLPVEQDAAGRAE